MKKLVNLAFKEKITVRRSQAIYKQLSAVQRERASDLVAMKAGLPLEQWRRERQKNLTEITKRRGVAPLGPTAEIWRQFIEFKWPVWPNVYPSSYWLGKYCEGTNADPDDDWVFYFPMSYSQNPDGLRWSNSSSQVYWAFAGAYGGNLNGFAFGWNEVRLCLGTGGVAAAGGAPYVKLTTFLGN